MGQKFTLDSWALSKLTYDSISDLLRVKSRIDAVCRGCEQQSGAAPHSVCDRRCVFCARQRCGESRCSFVLLIARGQVAPLLHDRMSRQAGSDKKSGADYRQFRDGLPFAANLQATRAAVDGLDPAEWQASIYSLWCVAALVQLSRLACMHRRLAALRELSGPSAHPSPTLQSHEWAMKVRTSATLCLHCAVRRTQTRSLVHGRSFAMTQSCLLQSLSLRSDNVDVAATQNSHTLA